MTKEEQNLEASAHLAELGCTAEQVAKHLEPLQPKPTWRDRFRVHPSADVFPMMSDEDLQKLGEDIKANGLKSPLVFCWVESGTLQAHRCLIDGRNRLEAMERVGVRLHVRSGGLPANLRGKEAAVIMDGDPVAHIISLNIHRRHLSKQQQVELIIAAHAAAKPRNDCEVSKGGRGKVDEVKAAVVASAETVGISKRTVELAMAKSRPKPERAARVEQIANKRQAEADKRQLEEHDRQVKEFMDATKAWHDAIAAGTKVVSKFSSEAKKFAVRRLDALAEEMAAMKEKLR